MNLIKNLTEQFGVSGCEAEIRNCIIDEIKNEVFKTETDIIGNLLVYKDLNLHKKTIALCAHMDEVGLIINAITDSGLLKFDVVGGIDCSILAGKTVVVGQKRILGIITLLPNSSENSRNSQILRNLYIDIGAVSRVEAEKLVSLGDYVAFKNEFRQLGRNLIKSKALDDRVGCALAIMLLRENFNCNIMGCFTVQEEIGLRGAKVLPQYFTPDLTIILDCTPSFDLPGIDIENNNIHCGSGPVLNICDRIAYYDKNFINLIIDISKRHQIPFQMKTEISGATDAAAIQILKNGMKTITISIPCRYMHSPSTIINMDDFKNTYKLVYEFIKEFQKS